MFAPVRSQAQEKVEFEVASVRPFSIAPQANDASVTLGVRMDGAQVRIGGLTMRDLLATAYRVRLYQLSGPEWIATERYDINAKLSAGVSPEKLPEMLQSLLADRFGIRVHRDKKEMPVYALLVAKGGPKLQRADIDEKDCPEASLNALGPVSTSTPIPDVCHAFNGGMGRGLYSRASSISDLAAYVENWTERPLLDKTGIKGLYRFETKGWQPTMGPSVDTGSSAVADRPTVFQIFEALGLRMEAQKGVVEVYVIDHIEKPSEN